MRKEKDIFESIEEEQPKNNKKNRKENKNKSIVYIVIALFIIIIIYALFVSLSNVGLLNFGNKGTTSKQKASLNYTETSKTTSGVYITDVSEVVDNTMPSIVAITSKSLINSGNYGPSFFGRGEDQYTEGAGSGIIISETDDELLILTNNHVIEGADELSVQFVNEKTADATVKGTSSRKDVAVISVKKSSLDNETKESIKIATIGDSNKLKVGNGIIAIGNALGYGQSVTTGVVSALNREVQIDNQTAKMIQIDAAINGGNSGGALLNSAGEVVGINSAKYSSSSYSSSYSSISSCVVTLTSFLSGKIIFFAIGFSSSICLGISFWTFLTSFLIGFLLGFSSTSTYSSSKRAFFNLSNNFINYTSIHFPLSLDYLHLFYL